MFENIKRNNKDKMSLRPKKKVKQDCNEVSRNAIRLQFLK